jgi:hypothetical protein
MNHRITVCFFLIFFYSNILLAAEIIPNGTLKCSSKGTTIYTVNGVAVDKKGAFQSREAVS